MPSYRIIVMYISFHKGIRSFCYMLLALLSPDLLPILSTHLLCFHFSLLSPSPSPFLSFTYQPLLPLIFSLPSPSLHPSLFFLVVEGGQIKERDIQWSGHVLKCKQLTAFSKKAPVALCKDKHSLGQSDLPWTVQFTQGHSATVGRTSGDRYHCVYKGACPSPQIS